MSLFPQERRSFTLILDGMDPHDTRSHMDNFPGTARYRETPTQVAVDIVPHRIVPREAYSFNDVVLALLGDGHRAESPRWNAHGMSPWTGPYGAAAFDHPTARIHPGAIVLSQPEFDTPATPDAIRVHFDATTLCVGDARFERTTFSAPSYTFQESQRARDALRSDASITPQHHALALGVVAAFIHSEQILSAAVALPAILARFARIGQECYSMSGRPALNSGLHKGIETLRHLLSLWAIRGDRIGAPQRLVPHASFAEMCTAVQDLRGGAEAFAAGQAAYTALAIATQGRPGLDAEGIAGTALSEHSAHARIALKALQAAIDTTLIRALPPLLLKPMAAKRHTRLHAAAA